MSELSVRLHDVPVGVLEQNNSGRMSFSYLGDAAVSLSLGMPLEKNAAYDDTRCEAFFGGLLPESEVARRAIGKKFGVNPNNSFSLLRAIGYDCAGAISLHLPDEPVDSKYFHELKGRVVEDSELAQHIRELPKRPLFLWAEGVRLSLAGAQDKAAVILINDQIAFPDGGCPTTHILKPGVDDFDGLTLNEFFCMRLAKRVGLNVANVELRRTENIDYLLIERYDRIRDKNGIARIHQEDFCQALGVVPKLKYQREGGPTLGDCFDLLRKTTRPAQDRNAFARAVVFNYLLGNRDAHGKNFSLLHQSIDQIRLAPLYDLLSTHIYEDLDLKMAMKIGGQYDAQELFPRHWEALCKEVGFGYKNLRKLLVEQAETLVAASRDERDVLEEQYPAIRPIADRIMNGIGEMSKLTLRRLEPPESSSDGVATIEPIKT